MALPTHAHGMEAITIRRANVVDADKVRYRVYSDATEFVAVIAESALMAVKVAGVKEPYRIVRDLPTEGIAIEAAKIAKAEAIENVMMATKPLARKADFRAEMKGPQSTTAERFIPMKLRDLSQKKSFEGFVIPHEILNQLIEAVRKPAPPPEAPAPKAESAAPVAPVVVTLEAPPPAPPQASDQSSSLELVDEPQAAPSGGEVLSADEVEKLLKE